MKLLYITSLSGKRINSFMKSAVVAAKRCGVEFTMACNMEMADLKLYEEDCKEYGISVVHIDFDRNPLSLKNVKAKKQLSDLMKINKYDVVHCNTPIGGLLGRICAKEMKVPYVIYQAHGFHFWKGAPLKNWLCYYPVEKFLARYTDLLLTINAEDYDVAKTFSLKKNGDVKLLHGVGVEVEKIQSKKVDKTNKRTELRIEQDAYVMVSVGELIPRKNQLLAISAFAKANIQDSYLLICGVGTFEDELRQEIKRLNIEDRVRLLGFRQDIIEILGCSDAFVFPSLQEGLPAALMEAMAVGVPCIASRIRGNIDLLGKEYRYLHDAKDIDELATMMKDIRNELEICANHCRGAIQAYDFNVAVDELSSIYNF